MKVSPREALLILLTVAAALFGGTILLARPKLTEWKDLRKRQAKVREDIKWARLMLEQRERWDAAYAKHSQRLSRFPADKKMDLHWRGVLNRVANSSGIEIVRLDASGEETRNGEVYELPLECRDWQGSLDAITKFLFTVETGKDMLDVRQLRIKPKSNLLNGRFSLSCAYTREGDTPTGAEETVTE